MKPISEVLQINSENEIVQKNNRYAPRGIKQSEIEQEIMVCPYCMDEVMADQLGCCSETSSHFQRAFVVDGEAVLDSECIVLEDQ